MHKQGEVCPSKPDTTRNYKKRLTKIDKFRSTKEWQDKRNEVKDRDKHLCQVCLHKLYETKARQYNFKNIQVHHITPMSEDWSRRLDDDNLISLCPYHHKMAEDGVMPKEVLYNLIESTPPQKG